ncbi:MAG: thiolase family protein [Candidatus Marinimicrobia bacterium]|jgi:acetyl-CoA acetyltransferase family protein|nr:thiolase family protein [Candidatus Neomarinimicrobiota bacterium]MBT3501313.1 thiolase family protein [Candidatus Neomarinimicrobiota bacterium]MBT3838513.1 thiolase family protein [Candidatus Neomarinimicrobiota bacterium]MBT3999895.1 thiolase family protein [Candidatus Neomarinimicrobiota bacterium]MBT4282544.1 thiolase family protein [Candidatus Neomarinimicrobiota bacterium]
MSESVIIDAVRSPIGVKNGNLVGIRADDLTAQVVKGLLARNENISPDKIEDLVLGCAFPEGPQGMLMAKGVAILAGIPETTGGSVVNRFCGSSMDAVHQISTKIESGDIEIGIAAGVEDMFSVPMGGFNPDFHPELAEQEYYIGMGETAETLAEEGNISRDTQEMFAVESHNKALDAWNNGRFDNEIIPIDVYGEVTVEKDEGPREPNLEKIQSLNPAFIENGTITPATSSPISIGASAVLITSREFAEANGLKIRATIKGRSVAGVDWKRMGMGPIPATNKVLKKTGLSLDDIDVIELNEAFSAQSLYVIEQGGWDKSKVNLNGGAIALGHPLGCSGARIITTLLNVMEQQDAKTGLATMCIGSGQGIATIIER